MNIDYNQITQGMLLDLSVKDLTLIKSDIELIINEKFKLTLAVDTHDILNYYTPFIDKNIHKYKEDAIVKRIVMHHRVFNFESDSHNLITDKILLLNEYLSELLFLKGDFENKLQQFKNYPESVFKLRSQVSNILNIKKNINLTPSQLDTLILFLLVNVRGKSLEEFYNFLNNKTYLTSDLDNLLTSFDDYKKMLLEPPNNKVTDDIYTKYIDENKFTLSRQGDGISMFNSLNNTYVDIQAICKVIDYNSYLQNDKHLLLYISTAKKTRSISEIIDKESLFKTIQGRDNYNIIRTIPQVFTIKILLNEYQNNKNSDPIHIVEDLIDIRSEVNNHFIPRAASSGGIIAFDMIKNVFDNYNKILKGHFLYDVFSQIKNQPIHPIVNKDKISPEKVIKYLDNYYENESIVHINFDMHIRNYKKKFLLSSLFSGNAFVLKVRYGNDIVKNSFHHLPYLIFISPNYRTDVLPSIYQFLNKISNIPDDNQKIDEGKIKLLRHVGQFNFDNMKKEMVLKQYVKNAIIDKYLYALLSKSENSINSMSFRQIYEDDIIKDIEKLKLIITSIPLESDLVHDSKENRVYIAKNEYEISYELDYILLWFYRRNRKNSEALSLGEKLIKERNNDGRFFHGYSLALVQEIYELLENVNINEDYILNKISTIINHLEHAKDLYYDLLKESSIPKNSYQEILVYKSISAVYNTLADVLIRKYELLYKPEKSNDYKILRSARNYLEESKKIIKKISENRYEYFPILNITEAELEYFEALHFYKSDLDFARKKISNALSRTEFANNNIIEKRFKAKIQAIRLLKSTIDKL